MKKQRGIRRMDYVFRVAKRTLLNSPYLKKSDVSPIIDDNPARCYGQPWTNEMRCGCKEETEIKRALYGLKLKEGGGEIYGVYKPWYFKCDGSVAFLHTKSSAGKRGWKDEVGIYIILDGIDALLSLSHANLKDSPLKLYAANQIAEKYYSKYDLELFSSKDFFYHHDHGLAFFCSTAHFDKGVLKADFGTEPLNTKGLEDKINYTLQAAHEFFSIIHSSEFRIYEKISEKIRSRLYNLVRFHKPSDKDVKEEDVFKSFIQNMVLEYRLKLNLPNC